MKKFAFLFAMVLALALTSELKAQDYDKAVGLRLGYPLSASFKFGISDPGYIEAYLGFRGFTGYSWVNVGAMYQHHFPIESVEGLYWYVGGGASAYFWNFKSSFLDPGDTFGLGINGALGLDYKFANAPINLSIDWLPTIFISGYGSGFGGGYGALAVRYTLN